MTFVVRELTDLAPVRSALLELSKINSPHLDVDAEARLPHARFWVASEAATSEPCAYTLVWLVADEVEIIDVATAAEQRRRGAARTLLVTLLDSYANAARQAAFLEVRAGNRAALGLYQSLGFERTRVRRGYYSNGEDAIEMRRELHSGVKS
jgi:[ribosomal protein S18]-alanine N-acetyltransferase